VTDRASYIVFSAMVILMKDAASVREVRAPYERPILRFHGSIEKITKGGVGGSALDADFPIKTPLDQLTTS
jgi:hypothetical protein